MLESIFNYMLIRAGCNYLAKHFLMQKCPVLSTMIIFKGTISFRDKTFPSRNQCHKIWTGWGFFVLFFPLPKELVLKSQSVQAGVHLQHVGIVSGFAFCGETQNKVWEILRERIILETSLKMNV